MKFVIVIDGDTFEAVDRRGNHRRIRLYAVDCPEMNQRNGQAAKDFVKKLVGSKWVRVRLLERDKYRRHVADVRVQGQCLALALVQAGLAYPLTNSWRLRVAAVGARFARRGVHSGFGQAKPWKSSSRTWWGRLILRRRPRTK